MNRRARVFTQKILPALFASTLLSGCAAFSHHGRTGDGRNRAFISYWPATPGSSGLRLAVKDLINMKGEVTTAGSEFFAKHSPPAQRDAACLQIARERGVRIVGKTNLTEFAVGVSGLNAYYLTPRNPINRRHRFIPGGSSSGCAVAVANGSADVALGTDTAGSIRIPAACCGVAGLKTTFGLVPLDGVYPIAPKELDTVGTIARDVDGLVQGMDLLQRGFAGKYPGAARSAARGIKVGRLYLRGTDPRIDQAVDAALARAGFRVVVLGEDFRAKWEQAMKDGRTIAAASAWLTNRKLELEPQVSLRTKAILALGAVEYTLNYRGALRRQRAWQTELRRRFRQVGFIALPTMQTLPQRAPPYFSATPAYEALVLASQNTVAVNYGGNPALALPIPVEDPEIPLTSVQLIGPTRGEAALLHAGRFIEQTRPPAAPAAKPRHRWFTARR